MIHRQTDERRTVRVRSSALGAIAFLTLVAATVGVACDKTAPPPFRGAARALEREALGVPANARTVSASGSSALQPLVNAAKEKFEAKNRDISVEVSAGGSKKGLADVAAGAVQIGDSDIFAPDDLKGQLVDHKVAVVGFAAMANKGAFDEKVAAISLLRTWRRSSPARSRTGSSSAA